MKTAFDAGHIFKCGNGHGYAEAAMDIASGTAPDGRMFKWIRTNKAPGIRKCADCGAALPGWVTFAQMNAVPKVQEEGADYVYSEFA